VRVLMISKALVVGAYQRKAEELAGLPGMELTVAVPPYWREGGHRLYLERAYTAGYELAVLPMVLNGHYHVHAYRRLAALFDIVAPDGPKALIHSFRYLVSSRSVVVLLGCRSGEAP